MSEQSFFERRGLRVAAIALVVLVLVGVGLTSAQQAAWSEGYMMGLIAGGGEGDALSQYVLYNNGRPGAVGSFFGGLFKVGFILLGFLFVGKFVRMFAWQHHNGRHGHGPWRCPPQDEGPRDDSGPEAAAEQGNNAPAATA